MIEWEIILLCQFNFSIIIISSFAFPNITLKKNSESVSHSVVSDSLQPYGL